MKSNVIYLFPPPPPPCPDLDFLDAPFSPPPRFSVPASASIYRQCGKYFFPLPANDPDYSSCKQGFGVMLKFVVHPCPPQGGGKGDTGSMPPPSAPLPCITADRREG